jgi:rhamnosyltransferase
LVELYKNVLAGVVLYNPDLEKLEKNVLSIYGQVNEIILIDNCSVNKQDIKGFILRIKREKNLDIKLIVNDQNKGIAYALNQILDFATQNHYKWYLTLDQDTECPDDLISQMLNYYNECDIKEKLAIIAPKFVDINNIKVKSPGGKIENGTRVLTSITSGSLNNVDIANKIGGYKSELFIDHVDHEFCLRLNKCGYNVVQLDCVEIRHEIGNINRHRFLWTTVATSNHSYIRRYYYYRNSLYIFKKYFIFFPKWTLKILLHDIINIVKISLYENDKLRKLKFAFKGLYDGMANNYNEMSNYNGEVK